MLTYLRYALATCCFVASVGCLALWGSTAREHGTYYTIQLRTPDSIMQLNAREERAVFNLFASPSDPTAAIGWDMRIVSDPREEWDEWFHEYPPQEMFGELPFAGHAFYCPLWYPALVFALAGVGALRLGRRFTLRSAIIATTVVAGLLGMAVGL
jgi:hypothetical protein